MAVITKVLMDDHQRLRRMFRGFGWGSFDQAMGICDELIIHTTIEEELVYPTVRDEIDDHLADQAEDEHEQAKQLMTQIWELQRDDPALINMMRKLQDAVFKHLDMEEKVMFPKLDQQPSDDIYELGRQAFALRQELLAVKPNRGSYQMGLTANTGWGKGANTGRNRSYTANLGW